jgi:hypothetical protein
MRSLKNPTKVGPMPVPASAYSIANTAAVDERMFTRREILDQRHGRAVMDHRAEANPVR